MTREERIQKCKDICQDTSQTPFEKLAGLRHYIWLPWYGEKDDEINYDYIKCPYCGEVLYPKDIQTDDDIMQLVVNLENASYFDIRMPCCGKEVFTFKQYI